ncbi:MAG: glycosyltransferase [Bacteroidales bacterium]|nr:glycosyltransferase [Bacteroidales bacterium]
MKVTFLFSGLPHYLIALLNRLVSVHGMEVSVIVPGKRGLSLGEGVKLGDEEEPCLFSVRQLEEYRGKFRKPYFRKLHSTLEELLPDIVVMGWPYIVNYSFDSGSRKVVRANNISLVFREIPFMVAPKNRSICYYRKNPIVNENLEVENPVGLRFYPWAFGLNLMRIRYYRQVDATMIYASHGFVIQESYGIDRKNIFLTYNSPDTEKIANIRQRLTGEGVTVSNPKRILHLGRLVKWKRVDLLIEATAKLSPGHDTLELCIIGEGPEETYLKQLVERKALKDRVKFLGSIYDPEDLGREILSSAIYVLAGMGGLSINEAMAFGKPVVCSRCDGTEKDLVNDGMNGLYFKEGDADDLASKIEILLEDPEKTRAMGAQSLSIIEEKINLDKVTRRFADCFEFLKKKENHGI